MTQHIKHIAVVGSREGITRELVEAKLAALTAKLTALGWTPVIVSGGARGVDTFAEDWARAHSFQAIVFRADWHIHGKSAGYKRNVDIVNKADIVVAFWDGQSRGTAHSIKLTRDAGKRLYIFDPSGRRS